MTRGTSHSSRGHHHSIALGALIVAWGVQAIVTQSLLLREAMVLMFGSEFAWGVVLFAWLLGVSVGAAIGGWLAGRLQRTDVALVIVLLLLGVAACAELWVFRGVRGWLGVGRGELLPLSRTALAAIVFVSPTSALIGIAFPLACCVRRSATPDGEGAVSREVFPLARVYALESAGSLIGGASFSFWAVEHLAPIATALVCLAITAATAGALLTVTRRTTWAGAGLGVMAAAVLVVAFGGGDTLNDRLVQRRWANLAPGYALRAEAESKFQNLAILQKADQFSLYCNGQATSDFPDPYTFVPQAHFWMYQHPTPKHVLLLGGGAEGLLAEVLQHPVTHVDYVETDPRVIGLVKPYVTDADRQALADARVGLHYTDARHFVKTQRGRFDLVIARLPEPTSALAARLYTDEFFLELRRAMTDNSVLCTTATASPGELSALSGQYLASIRATLRRHFPIVTVGWGDPALVFAATKPGLLATDVETLTRRQADRGVEAELYHPLLFAEPLDADKMRRRADELDAVAEIDVSTDLRPVIYVQRLALWDWMMGGEPGGVIQRLRSVRLSVLALALAFLGVVTLVVCYVRDRVRAMERGLWVSRGAIVLSIGTTGFASMALSVVWLFAFQNLYGYVYQRIGWIIAVFMGGLVIGCWLADRFAQSRGGAPGYLWSRLMLVDLLLALLALSVPLLLTTLGGLQTTGFTLVLVEWSVTVMVALTGVLGGAAFALAGRLQLAMTGRTAAAAGSVDAADHAGACAGALLTGILLVPVFGTATAAFVLVGMKLSSVALLAAGWRSSRAA